MSFGRFRLLSALSASAFCFWKRAECTSDQSTCKDSPTKPTHDDYFMATAFVASLRSKDPKRKVGACIVTEYPHRLVGLGYNGMPDGIGFNDFEMKECWKKRNFVCHAEMNAIISAFRRQADLSSCTLYTTLSPCAECSKLIVQSGIKNVVYAQEYNECDDMRKLLAPLPALNVKHYEYLGDKAYGKIIIDLGKMKAFQQVSVEKCSDAEKDKSKTKKKELSMSLNDNLPMDDYFMALATLATLRSKSSNPVGACLVTADPYCAISVGYHGLSDYSEQEEDEYMCHAESNAIISAFRNHADLTSSILYTTSPLCCECAKIIIQSGVRTVIYSPMEDAGKSKDLECAVAVDEIFYRAKIPYLKYQNYPKKTVIIIDLKNHTVEQRVCDCENED